MVQIKIWVLQDKVAPVCYEIIAYGILSGFFLDNRKNEMQVGMYQLIEFHTSGANHGLAARKRFSLRMFHFIIEQR